VPVFIAYADVPAARNAISRIAQLLRATRGDCQLQPLLWRFDQLEIPRWREMALSDAARAQTLAVAMSDASSLSDGTGAWLISLATGRHGAPLDVLALVGEDEVWSVSLQQTQAFASQHASPAPAPRVGVTAAPAPAGKRIPAVAA
jgi:hypothetical protein